MSGLDDWLKRRLLSIFELCSVLQLVGNMFQRRHGSAVQEVQLPVFRYSYQCVMLHCMPTIHTVSQHYDGMKEDRIILCWPL